FSRRLGYLDGSPEAQQIVRGWLGSGGLLAEVIDLNKLWRDIFRSIVPVAPEAALSALERPVLASASDESAKKCARHVPLLVSLEIGRASCRESVKITVDGVACMTKR